MLLCSMRLLEHVSLWGSVLGATLIALHIPISGWAFIPYLLSNFASIYLLQKSDAPKVIQYQIIYFVIMNIIGVFRWIC
jgi:hypothetical protein